MREVVIQIAESMVKAVGIAGIDAIAMRRSILSAWTEKAKELGDKVVETCIDLTTGHVYPERADGILVQYRVPLGQDFIEAVIADVEEYVGHAYDRGEEYAYQSIFTGVLKGEKYFLTEVIEPDGTIRSRGIYAETWEEAEEKARARSNMEIVVGEFVDRKSIKDDRRPRVLEYVGKRNIAEEIITDLTQITGASKSNVVRTIARWFKTTQGEYFNRFIVPETARLLSYAQQQEGNIATLRSIGENYKRFVEADGYWSSISEFNTESSKIFAQVQTLHELHISEYRIEAIIDNKTCEVCMWLNGSTWQTSKAIERVMEMLVMEAEQAYEVNPFPPRSTPKDFDTPEESPYGIPPFHPRCRCNIVSAHAVQMAPRRSATPVAPTGSTKPLTDRQLNVLFNKYVSPARTSEIEGAGRALTGAEFNRVKQAFNDMPYELRKWIRENQQSFKIVAIPEGMGNSRLIGNVIEIAEKYLGKGYGPQVIQHELRHALINPAVIKDRGGAVGANALWEVLTKGKKTKIPMPIHVNEMYKLNRGVYKISSAVDEYLAMIGDYYRPGMSFDELVKAVRAKGIGIEVEKKLGSLSTNFAASRMWTASEAKKAVQQWWDWMDIDNYTLMSKKQVLAKMNHKPSTAAIRRVAIENERRLKKLLEAAGVKNVSQLGDNEPFDVWIGANPVAYYSGASKVKPRHVIEVKTIVRAKNDKITMHKESLARKRGELKKFGKKNTTGHTVVFDERTGKFYYRDDLGSFNLSAMREVTESEIQVIFGGKAAEVRYADSTKYAYKEITTKKAFEEFKSNMEKVKPEHKLFLDWYSWKEYQKKGIRLYMEENGFTGYGITKDNTLVTLWTRADAPRGIGRISIEDGLLKGVTRLECFDGKLPTIYSKFGFKEVERYPWNAEFAPKGWDYKKFGKPDYLVMKRGPEGRLEAARSTERLSSIQSASPKIKTVKSSTLKTKETISEGNVNEVRIVTVGSGKKKYIFKPVEGESYYSPGDVRECMGELRREFPHDFNVTDTVEYIERLKARRFPDYIMDYIDDNDLGLERVLIRRTISNDSMTLAQREAFALDVAQRLGLDNDNAVVPKFMLATDNRGDLAGVLIEYVPNAKVETAWFGRNLLEEEKLQMAAFDYIIGNTDRHENNWMRVVKGTKTRPEGVPVYIDHGYIMPNQYFDLGGLAEFRCHAAAGAYSGMEWDVDPDFLQRLILRIQRFSAEEIDDLARRYGFDSEEIDAMLRRTESLLERLRGGTFGTLLKQHEENGIWGVEDSFIG